MQAANASVHKSTVSTITYTRSQPQLEAGRSSDMRIARRSSRLQYLGAATSGAALPAPAQPWGRLAGWQAGLAGTKEAMASGTVWPGACGSDVPSPRDTPLLTSWRPSSATRPAGIKHPARCT